jgi:DeoR/GlpR family transcriptional regulator of sugar metabolism
MLKQQRHTAIVRAVRERDVVSVHDLAELCAASLMTVRRDLEALERRGLVTRVHGGARTPDPAAPVDVPDAPLDERAAHRTAAKEAIAERAATLVPPGAGVLLGGGTTVAALAARLAGRPLTVVTDSLLVADALRRSERTTLHLLGGRYRPGSGTVTGPVAVEHLLQVRLQVAFISASAVADGWLCHYHPEDAPLVQAMLEAARETWLLVDASKFEAAAVGRVAPLDRVRGVITDAPADVARAAVGDGAEIVSLARPAVTGAGGS